MPNAKKRQYILIRTPKYYLIKLTFIFCHFTSFGQQSNIDSLLSVLKIVKEDTNKVNTLNNLSEELWQTGNYEKAKQYGVNALKYSEKINFKKGKAKAYFNIAVCYSNEDNYSEAFKNALQSLKIYEEIDNKQEIAGSLLNMGKLYYEQNNISEALKYFLQASKLSEEIGYKKGIAESFANTAVAYSEKGNIFQRQGDTIKANSNYKIALEKYNVALKIFEELGKQAELAGTHFYIGEMNFFQKNYTKALENYFAALKIFERLGANDGVNACYISIGKIYTKQAKYINALKYLNKGKTFKKKYFLKERYNGLSEVYEKMGQHKKALEYYKLYSEIKESMSGGDVATKTAKLQNQYQNEKEEKIRKLQEEKKEAEYNAEVKQQQTIIFSVAIGLLLMVVFAGFIFHSLRITRKQKYMIEVQKSEVEKSKYIIEEKNKDITDSITYAMRIQQAKLPNKEEIYYSLPTSFILFKPKDIVSGDFYFFRKTDQCIFIAAADCTGHGVPGAFMSMIGSEKLEDAISQSMDTSVILKQLNKGIKTSLRQSDSDESTRDGMDIALCSVDTQNFIVKYAGANRPIWIIRNGPTEIEEIKATKTAIGGLTEDDQHFDTHEIKLQKGDTFYICTDGYADQFSGNDEKKLMTKKFKEILLNIQGKSMQEQEQYLDNFIENWKAGTEQVDDILVIGVRL